ncbi:retrotransposon protein, putative, ty1-copia subclass [Tanacetum coccineum]
MLKELKSMFEKQAGVERFDLIQSFHACKQEEGKPVAAYVLKMKGYVEQLERLGYVLPQYLIVGLILNGLTSDFARFEKGLPKKAETPQVMAIRGDKIQKANKKSLKAKGKGKANGKGKDKHVYIPKPKNPKPSAKEHPAKDDTCHHCKEGLRGARKLEQGALYLQNDKKTLSASTERATDLFGIIHTDVCGPLRRVSRQGASYFITFTDDYSRYGYVYLLKHKHEVFETFKVFKNEVENQLRKTIKALRSDRGGKYISQEFKDYLKACGIVQQLTPPYTPQHNGVSERRNRTLLDMGNGVYAWRMLGKCLGLHKGVRG